MKFKASKAACTFAGSLKEATEEWAVLEDNLKGADKSNGTVFPD